VAEVIMRKIIFLRLPSPFFILFAAILLMLFKKKRQIAVSDDYNSSPSE
jgi:hypothetical protein